MRGPVLVVGPGAIGALFAARLAAAGRRVVVACRPGPTASAVRRDGVTAIPEEGPAVQAEVAVATAPADVPEAAGLCVLATKCAAAEGALRKWLPAVREDAAVVAVQNGVLGDRLKPLAGDRLVECTVALPATLEGPGRSRQTGPGSLHLGPWPQAGPRDDPAFFRAVAEELAPVAPVRGSGNMRGVKWCKLLVNSCITSLGAATGLALGDLLGDPRARRAFLAITREGYRAGRADGVRFEAVAGFRPGLVASGIPGLGALLRLQGRRYRRQRSSSLQSLQRGEATEVDFLNGEILAAAARHGVAAPVNAALSGLLHDIEAGRRRPEPANLGLLP